MTPLLKLKLSRLFFFSLIYLSWAPYFEGQAFTLNCESLFAPVNKSYAFSLDPKFAPKEATLIRGVIRRLQKLASEVVIPTPDIEKKSENYLESSYRSLGNKLLLGFSNEREDIYKSLVVMAHEYGHAIFDLNIIFNFEGHQLNSLQIASMVAQIRQEIISRDDYKAAMMGLREKSKNLNFRTQFEEDAIFKRFGGDEYYRLSQLAKNLSDIMITHNELFADMVAVMLAKDGNAVANVFKGSHPDSSGDLSRSFLPQTPIKGYTNGAFDPGNQFYEILSPARSFLWSHCLSTLPRENYPKLIKAYLRAAQAHLNALLATGETPRNLWLHQDAEKINPDFIKFLETEINNLGILANN